MSHRVTTKTEIKDKNLAVKAIQNAGMSYRDLGNNQLEITSGKLNRARINLATGEVVGDTDYHTEETLGMLRQGYAVVKYKEELTKQGAYVNSETTNEDGEIILHCVMA